MITEDGGDEFAGQPFAKANDAVSGAGRDLVDDLRGGMRRVTMETRRAHLGCKQERAKPITVAVYLRLYFVQNVRGRDGGFCCCQVFGADEIDGRGEFRHAVPGGRTT